MKKILITVKICFFIILFFPVFVLAEVKKNDLWAFQSRVDELAPNIGYSTEVTLFSSIGAFIQVALSLLGVIFLLLTIYAGYLWMTDRGNEQQAEKAKKILTTAVIGLIIVLGAYAISYFVIEALQSKTLKS